MFMIKRFKMRNIFTRFIGTIKTCSIRSILGAVLVYYSNKHALHRLHRACSVKLIVLVTVCYFTNF